MAEIVSAFGLVGAAVVTGIFSILAQRMRQENDEITQVESSLEDIQKMLEEIDEDLDEVIDWQSDHDKLHKGKMKHFLKITPRPESSPWSKQSSPP